MAGANYQGGTEETKKTVPSIGGPATIAADGHTSDGNRAEGVNYDSNQSIGTGGPEGSGYPAGTAMTDNTPSDSVN